MQFRLLFTLVGINHQWFRFRGEKNTSVTDDDVKQFVSNKREEMDF